MSTRYRIKFEGLWRSHQIHVVPAPSQRLWPAQIERAAVTFWQERVVEIPGLFNGRLSSLEGVRHEDGRLTLMLGETRYRDLLFSNARAAEWLRNSRKRWLSRALGISALVQAAGDEIVLMRRSQTVGEYPGAIDVIGGHIDPGSHAPNGATPDVFFAIRDEVHSELNLSPGEMSRAACLGLLENCENGKPELVFWVRVKLPLAAILTVARSARESAEYVELFGVPATAGELKQFLARNSMHCSPSAEGSLVMFSRFLQTRAAGEEANMR